MNNTKTTAGQGQALSLQQQGSPSAVIFYFSQTGATRQVAESIARGLQLGGMTARAADLLKTKPAEAAGADLIGLGAPVFYYKEPLLVKQFIAQLPETPRGKKAAAFTFITHGGNPVNTLRRMQKQLARRGYTVINSFSSTGFDSYPMYLKSFREWGRPNGDDLQAAADFGERLPQERRWFLEETRFALPRYKFVGGKYFFLSLFLEGSRMKKVFPPLVADETVCTRCGTCMRHCPTKAITLQPCPKVSQACIWCYLCERICPVQAFKTDWTKLRKKMKVE